MTIDGMDLRHILRTEWFLGVSLLTALAFLLFGHDLLAHLGNPWTLAQVTLWLLVAVIGSALNVVRHAERLAELLGEPFGTLILTLSVTTIEVLSISAVVLTGEDNPTLVRDTMFAVVMIVLGGMAGLSLLLGGLKHSEQTYNLHGANAYLTCIIPLAVLTLLLPNYTVTTAGPTLSPLQSIFIGCMSLGIYVVFLAIQAGRHRDFFVDVDRAGAPIPVVEAEHKKGSTPWHIAMLVCYMLPVSYLAEELAQPLNYMIETLHAPVAMGGLAIAAIVATPEAVEAIRAAASNHLQRAVNISMGSALSTIGLTIPAMFAMTYFTGRTLYLGLQGANSVLLMLILSISVVTFTSGRTNILQGAVHLLLFAAFVLLVFEG